MNDLMPRGGPSQMRNGRDVYRNFPTLLAPQLKLVFQALLRQQTPLVYNCSAGQDRTGFVTAMVLSALGVSRDQIVADYHLSTRYRRPEWEMPKLDPAAHPGDPVAAMFASYQRTPARPPDPLKDADGRPFLAGAFEAIDTRWGSVDAYLRQAVGLTPADVAKLRRLYLQ
jgi:protein-tyrosine phosphatase